MIVIRALSQWRFTNKIELDKSQWSGMMGDLESISDHNLIYDQSQARQVDKHFIKMLHFPCIEMYGVHIDVNQRVNINKYEVFAIT